MDATGVSLPQSARAPRRLALITSQAYSLSNFRGPLIRELVEAGVQVFALAPDYDDATRTAVEALGAQAVDYSIQRTGLSPVADGKDFVSLVRRLRSLNADASLAYFIKPAIYGTLAARLAGIRRRFVMIEGAGYVYADDDSSQSWRRLLLRSGVTGLYRCALRGAEKVFFLNREDASLFIETRMARPAQVCELPGIGVPLEHFAVTPLPAGPPVFLLSARMLAHKGVREYVEAARRIRREHPELRFLLLGSPDRNPASISAQELQEWHALGIVEWQAFVTDVRPWISAASVLVLPSWYREGVPRSIQEAMAMGRPVITTDMPGCRDTIVSGESGWVVPPRDVDALVEAMMCFVESPAMANEMGQAARLRAEERFDVRRINQKILSAMGL